MPMRGTLLLVLAVLLVTANSGFAAISDVVSNFEPAAVGQGEQRIEDQRVDRIRTLERLLTPSDEERRAELIYLASIEFLGFLQQMRPNAGPDQRAGLDDVLSDPRSYRTRIRHDGGVIYVAFVPKNETIRGGGAEVGIDKASGRTVSIQPLM